MGGRGERTDAARPGAAGAGGTFDCLALGDVHRHYDLVRRIARRESALAPFTYILTVGDFSDSTKHLAPEDPECLRHVPIVRCGGNHERWSQLETLPGRYVAPAEVLTLERPPLRVLGFGGVFTSTNWEADPAGWRDGRRKSMTRVELERAKAARNIDVLLTHETGSYLPNFHTADRGQRIVRELVEAVRPRIHLSGHHHHLVVRRLGPTVGFMLPIPTTAHLRLHFSGGELVAYSVARQHDKHFELISERVPVPATGDDVARVGVPGTSHYYESRSDQARR